MRRRDMSGVIDGAFDTPEGRKLFVSQRPNETGDDFATRAMGFLQAMGDGHVLDRVLASAAIDWEVLPRDRWLEAVNRSEPRLRLRVTALSSGDGASVGHLVIECEAQLVADDWAKLVDGHIYVPRAEDGRIRTWQAGLWSLAHEIRGMGNQFDAALARNGLTVA
jgi:hypothetical protein